MAQQRYCHSADAGTHLEHGMPRLEPLVDQPGDGCLSDRDELPKIARSVDAVWVLEQPSRWRENVALPQKDP